MCGISGIINGGDAHLLARMNDIMSHRGLYDPAYVAGLIARDKQGLSAYRSARC